MTRVCLLVFTWLFLSQGLLADELTSQKTADIRKLLEVIGAARLAAQVMNTQIQDMLGRLNEAARPEEKMSEEELRAVNSQWVELIQESVDAPAGLMERLVPIYSAHFTRSEIRDLLAFYRTKTGRKYLEVLPSMTAEASEAGREWGESLGKELRKRWHDAHPREESQPGMK
jgi:hypothetical protein